MRQLAIALVLGLTACASPDPAAPPVTAPPREVVSLALLSEVDGQAVTPSALEALVRERLERFGATPPLRVTGRSSATYRASEMYDQVVAHNFVGSVEVEVADAPGARLALTHEWGYPANRKTKAETLAELHAQMHVTAVLWLLTRPEVRARIEPARHAEVDAFVREQRERQLRRVGEVDCDVRRALVELGAP